MSLSDRSPNQAAAELAAATIHQLRTALEALVLDPTAQLEPRHLDAFGEVVTTATTLITASRDRRGQPYAMKDVAIEVQRDFDAAKHALRMLRAVHGPQAAPETTAPEKAVL